MGGAGDQLHDELPAGAGPGLLGLPDVVVPVGAGSYVKVLDPAVVVSSMPSTLADESHAMTCDFG